MMIGMRVQTGAILELMPETMTADSTMVILQHKSLAGMLPTGTRSVTAHRQTAGMATSTVCLGARQLLRNCKQGTGA